MSISGVASRFACLQDDDTTDWKAPKSKKNNKKASDASKKQENTKQQNKPNKSQQETRDLQSAAFGPSKKSKKKKGGAAAPATDQQFDEWAQRDKVMVDDNFEQQMQAAIVQSKMDFEERKELLHIANGDMNGDSNEDGKGKKKTVKATKKSAVMSLGEFQNPEAVKNSSPPILESQISRGKSETPDTDYFDELDAAASKALTREQLLESYRSTEMGSESALVTDYREKLADKEQELQTALRQVTEGKAQLTEVKKRYKKMCGILMSGEMKEKAEILVEAEKLRKVKDELSEELTDLHTQLEQERSRVHDIESELSKAKIDPDVIARILNAAGSPEHRARRISSGWEGLECPSPSCRRPGEGVGQDTAALVRVSCSNETCGLAPFMHKDCFNAFEEAALQFLKTSGRGRNWNDKQRQANLWSRKGYDLAYKACSCKCGHGHVKKEDASL